MSNIFLHRLGASPLMGRVCWAPSDVTRGMGGGADVEGMAPPEVTSLAPGIGLEETGVAYMRDASIGSGAGRRRVPRHAARVSGEAPPLVALRPEGERVHEGAPQQQSAVRGALADIIEHARLIQSNLDVMESEMQDMNVVAGQATVCWQKLEGMLSSERVAVEAAQRLIDSARFMIAQLVGKDNRMVSRTLGRAATKLDAIYEALHTLESEFAEHRPVPPWERSVDNRNAVKMFNRLLCATVQARAIDWRVPAAEVRNVDILRALNALRAREGVHARLVQMIDRFVVTLKRESPGRPFSVKDQGAELLRIAKFYLWSKQRP